MKLRINLSLFLLVFFSFSNESLSLSDYQIKKYCTKEKRISLCIKDLREKYVRDRLPVHFKQISDQLKSSGGPFLFGADLTMADIWFLPRIRYLQKGICDNVPTTCLDSFPDILAWRDAMMAVPNIKKWYESH